MLICFVAPHFVKNLQLSIWIRESQAQTDVQAGAVTNRVYFTNNLMNTNKTQLKWQLIQCHGKVQKINTEKFNQPDTNLLSITPV